MGVTVGLRGVVSSSNSDSAVVPSSSSDSGSGAIELVAGAPRSFSQASSSFGTGMHRSLQADLGFAVDALHLSEKLAAVLDASDLDLLKKVEDIESLTDPYDVDHTEAGTGVRPRHKHKHRGHKSLAAKVKSAATKLLNFLQGRYALAGVLVLVAISAVATTAQIVANRNILVFEIIETYTTVSTVERGGGQIGVQEGPCF